MLTSQRFYCGLLVLIHIFILMFFSFLIWASSKNTFVIGFTQYKYIKIKNKINKKIDKIIFNESVIDHDKLIH